jgi:cytochrome b involved in lipid metabolism
MAKQITLEELKSHKDSQGLWIAIHDKVYDITKFLDEVGVCQLGLKSVCFA